jgi:hypothetical protein
MQVAGDKAAAILGVNSRVGSVKAGAETISVIKVGVKVGIKVSIRVGIEIGAEVRIEVGAEVRIATIKEIRRTSSIKRTGLITKVFKGFKVRVRFFGKS